MKVKVIFTYHDMENNLATERLWAEKEGEFYRIKNIPFFFPNIAYDDLVDVEIDEGELFFDKLIEESGNSTIQIIVFNNIDIATITNQIEAMRLGRKSFERLYFG